MAAVATWDRNQAVIDSLRGVREGMDWQTRVRRAMGEWMGRQTPDYWVREDRWVAIHEIRISPDAVIVEWEYLGAELYSSDWYEINAGATTLLRHDAEIGDVADAEWWEWAHEELRRDVGCEWGTVQMVGSAAQTLVWEATR